VVETVTMEAAMETIAGDGSAVKCTATHAAGVETTSS
jgi:hypothetical protein